MPKKTPQKPTRAETEAWRDLHRELAKVTTFADAKRIAKRAAPEGAARFYSNLGRFLKAFRPPKGATRSELYVYRKLLLRFRS